jgi:peptide/nickel transport system ATP-binding protein
MTDELNVREPVEIPDTVALPEDATIAPSKAAEIRGRRQWPLPKLAVPDAPLLEVNDLKTHFKLRQGWVRAVDGVSFGLADGEALGLAGESACGKTTTALSLMQLLPSNGRIRGGSVKLFGINLVGKSDRAMQRYRWREISMVFQGAMNALNPVIRVRDQIAEPIQYRLGQSEAAARTRAVDLLDLVGIPRRRAGSYPHEMSGGMRQRAMIAMALACDPAIVIGDEPTTALDVMVQAQVMTLMKGLVKDTGVGMILISHDLSVISDVCDRVAVMYAGRVVENGPAKSMFTDAVHPYAKALTGAFPVIGDPSSRMAPRGLPGDPPDPRELPSGCPFHVRCAVAIDECLTNDVRLRPVPGADNRSAACVHVGHQSAMAAIGENG